MQGVAVVSTKKLSGHREDTRVSWDLQGGVQTFEGVLFGGWPRERET